MATGKRLRSTNVVPPEGLPVSTVRRPLTITSVLFAPRLRRLSAVEPRTAAVVPPSLMPMELDSGRSRRSSVRLVRPLDSMSARVMILTGEGPSRSTAAIREPVTSNFSSFWVSSAFFLSSVFFTSCAARTPTQNKEERPKRAAASAAVRSGLFMVLGCRGMCSRVTVGGSAGRFLDLDDIFGART